MALHKDIIERANARLGTVLKGKWRLDALIGIGGMASVYAATHRNQARAAIKLLHPEVALDAEVTARFLREGYVANAVGHPGTVTVLDDDVSEDNAPFLVMELLLGQTLDTMLALEPDGLGMHEVVPLLEQLLDVLAAAHEKGIVHRDLKPENLFLTGDGRLKVLDFGIARLRELTSANSPSATQAGSVLGTPAFMAPEQALGRWHEVDGRTDIWSVGATAFTLLTGQFVHPAQSLQEQLVLSATRPARRLREVRPELPEHLAAIVDRALSFERADRFPNASEMRGALRRISALARQNSSAPLSPRRSEAGHVVAIADEHGATLVAPIEVTSAITGRASSPTGQPVTRSAVIREARKARHWPLVSALILFGVGVSALVLAVGRRMPRAEPPPASASLSPPAAPPSMLARTAPSVVPSTPLSAAAGPTAQGSMIKPAPAPLGAGLPPPKRPQVSAPKPVEHSLPTPVTPPNWSRPAAKSLIGSENPFDRRH